MGGLICNGQDIPRARQNPARCKSGPHKTEGLPRRLWWGRFWERLVRSIKRPLKKVIGRTSLSFDELRTLIVEIEGLLNARPITYVYDDTEAISYPLAPSHLVYGRRITTSPNTQHYEVVSTHKSLTRRLRHHNYSSDLRNNGEMNICCHYANIRIQNRETTGSQASQLEI